MIDPLLCAVSIVLCSILLEKSIEEDCVRKEAKKMFKEQISEASFVPVSARIDNKYIVVISILFWVYDIRFIFMIVTGLFENGIFVCMFLMCLSGVVVFFFGRLYILAYKKADESPIAYSVQAISAITFVYAIVCGGLEFVGSHCYKENLRVNMILIALVIIKFTLCIVTFNFDPMELIFTS